MKLMYTKFKFQTLFLLRGLFHGYFKSCSSNSDWIKTNYILVYQNDLESSKGINQGNYREKNKT